MKRMISFFAAALFSIAAWADPDDTLSGSYTPLVFESKASASGDCEGYVPCYAFVRFGVETAPIRR